MSARNPAAQRKREIRVLKLFIFIPAAVGLVAGAIIGWRAFAPGFDPLNRPLFSFLYALGGGVILAIGGFLGWLRGYGGLSSVDDNHVLSGDERT